jgi:hypothetical protein
MIENKIVDTQAVEENQPIKAVVNSKEKSGHQGFPVLPKPPEPLLLPAGVIFHLDPILSELEFDLEGAVTGSTDLLGC